MTMRRINPASSIPELIKHIRHSYRECEFDEVQNTLMEREKMMRVEIENLTRDRDVLMKEVDLLQSTERYSELEKHDLEEKLGWSERRCEDLDRLIIRLREETLDLKSEKSDVEEQLGRSESRCEDLDRLIIRLREEILDLKSEKSDVEEQLGRSERRCEDLDRMIIRLREEILELKSEKSDVEEKLGRSESRCEEVDRLAVEKFEKFRSEMLVIEEKRARTGEEYDEMKGRLVSMGKRIEELSIENLYANRTIEELRARDVESDCILQELELKKLEVTQRIDELRGKKIESCYESDLDDLVSLRNSLENGIPHQVSTTFSGVGNLAESQPASNSASAAAYATCQDAKGNELEKRGTVSERISPSPPPVMPLKVYKKRVGVKRSKQQEDLLGTVSARMSPTSPSTMPLKLYIQEKSWCPKVETTRAGSNSGRNEE